MSSWVPGKKYKVEGGLKGGWAWYVGKIPHPDTVHPHLFCALDGETFTRDDDGKLFGAIPSWYGSVLKEEWRDPEEWVTLVWERHGVIHCAPTGVSKENKITADWERAGWKFVKRVPFTVQPQLPDSGS